MQRRTGAVPAADDELNDGVCQQPGQGRGNLRLELVADGLGEGGAEVFAAFECAAQRVGQAAADVVDRLFPGAGGVFGGLDASLSRRLLVEQLRQFAARFDLALDGGVGVRAFGRARELLFKRAMVTCSMAPARLVLVAAASFCAASSSCRPWMRVLTESSVD